MSTWKLYDWFDNNSGAEYANVPLAAPLNSICESLNLETPGLIDINGGLTAKQVFLSYLSISWQSSNNVWFASGTKQEFPKSHNLTSKSWVSYCIIV